MWHVKTDRCNNRPCGAGKEDLRRGQDSTQQEAEARSRWLALRGRGKVIP